MRYYLILFLLTKLSILYSQNLQIPNYSIESSFGIEAHDKRLFEFPQRAGLLEEQPEYLGTYSLTFNINKRILKKSKTQYSIGVGLGTELSTFQRPFDPNFPEGFGPDILLYTNRYHNTSIQFPLRIRHKLFTKFYFFGELVPKVTFLTIAQNTQYNLTEDNSWLRLNGLGTELNAGVYVQLKTSSIGLKTRIFQLKPIDKIIFNNIISDPRLNDTYEIYNPFKISISYLQSIIQKRQQ